MSFTLWRPLYVYVSNCAHRLWVPTAMKQNSRTILLSCLAVVLIIILVLVYSIVDVVFCVGKDSIIHILLQI